MLHGDQSHQWSSHWRRKWTRVDSFGVEENSACHVRDA